MRRKAQLQTFETIAVIFIFFILVGIGAIFYARIQKSNIGITKYEYSQSKSVIIAQRVMFMPELQCSEDKISRENCIDALKIDAAKKIMGSNQIYYYDLLEFSEINITQIYPSSSVPKPTTVYSRKLEKPGSSFLTYVPISIYNSTTRIYGFGVLSIETQAK
ncbi:hypothetical protein HY637_03200 [Candidatus Woesearchaeota archaeon]|nr:hypothetical protein [Candidatus Woesearchaeota archaeon]